MCTSVKMKCVKYFLYNYLIVGVTILGVGSIRNYPTDKNLIAEEDRRGAEKLEQNSSPTETSETKTAETKKRALFLTGLHRSQHSFINPGIGIGYRPAEKPDYQYEGHEGHGGHGFPPGIGEGRPFYPDTGSRGGYFDHYPSDYGGVYGHGGGYEYPVTGYGHGYGHGPPTSVGHHGGGGGGGYKNLKGLLLPLAGIALLGAAAALTANPVLLQLGVINGRRRRRGLLQEFNNYVYPSDYFIRSNNKLNKINKGIKK